MAKVGIPERARTDTKKKEVSISAAETECYSCLLRCETERNHLFLARLHTYLDTFATLHVYPPLPVRNINIFYDAALKR